MPRNHVLLHSDEHHTFILAGDPTRAEFTFAPMDITISADIRSEP